MYFRNTWVLLTFFHSPSIKCWSPCSWGKLCAWTAAWTFPCYPLSNTALEGFQMFTIFWSALLDIQLSFVVVKPHWSCWQDCLQEKEEKRQEQMCSRHVWPFLSFERYNEKEQMCSKHVWPSKLCPCLNFKRYNDDTSENLSNIDPPV